MEIVGYDDLEEIGRGGFAVVYRAHQAHFGREVAIKVLTTPGFGPTDRARFEREALAMGRLSWHPHIVVVHETGVTADGLPYLVEEYLEAGSLGDKLERHERLGHEEAVADVIQLCAAVHAAHETDLLHRDIKPDNVLLDAFGRVKLADFGIAAVTGSTLTATGTLTATIAHAAPEVLNGERATFASDVYSLGSTLYELLAGAPAFVRDTDESIVPLVVRVTTDPLPDLRPAGIPDPVARAVESAMAKDPADRPTALAFGRRLQQAQAALGLKVTELAVREDAEAARHDETLPVPVVAPPAPAADPGVTHPSTPTGTVAAPVGDTPPPGSPRIAPDEVGSRSRLPLVLGLVGLLAVAAAAFFLLSGGDDPSDDDGPGPGDGDEGPATPSEIAVGDRPFRVAVGGRSVWVTNADSRSLSRLDIRSGEVTDTIDLGGEVIGVDADEADVWVVDTSATAVVRLSAALDGERTTIPVGGQPRIIDLTANAVWVSNVAGNEVMRIEPATDAVTATIAVGTDPRGLVASETDVWVTNYADGTVSRIDVATNAVVATVEVGGTPVSAILTADAVWVAETETDSLIRIDPATNEEVDRMAVGDAPNGLAVRDGELFVSTAGDDRVSRIDTTSGEVLEVYEVGDAPGGIALSADDLWVANTEGDTVTRIPLG